jgi:hypothetical protein
VTPQPYFYIFDIAAIATALGAVAIAYGERGERIFPRWRLLVPGVLAFLTSTLQLGYPDFTDLFDAETITVGVAGLIVGVVRGASMGLDSDLTAKVVRLGHGADSFWVAIVLLVVACLQGMVEIRTHSVNPFEPTVEGIQLLCSGYLLGRSALGWAKSLRAQHIVLRED